MVGERAYKRIGPILVSGSVMLLDDEEEGVEVEDDGGRTT